VGEDGASKGTQMKAEELITMVIRAVTLAMRYGNRMAIFIAFAPSAELTNDLVQLLTDLTDRRI
jgi:hypothetical protein